MGAPLSIEARSLLGLLADGEWHDLESIRVGLAARVAPGKALRRYDERLVSRLEREGPRRTDELPEDQRVASGQRTIAGIAINSMKHRYVEIKDCEDGVKRIRKRPNVVVEAEPVDPTPLGGTAPTTSQVEAQPAQRTPGVPEVTPDSCERCGLWVTNQAHHEEWHQLQERESSTTGVPAVAFFSEEQVRAIVTEEIAKALDRFQHGMQTWLIHRFAAVEALVQGVPKGQGNRAERRSRAPWR